jgi:hypothetical protein
MQTDTEELALRTWRQQLDNATLFAEATSEGTMRLSELQLRAATEANEMVDQARKLLDKASSPLELWRIQSDWLALSISRSLDYFNEFAQAASETQSQVTQYWYAPGSTFPTQTNVLPGASKTAFMMMDDAYRRWHETTMQIWDVASDSTPQRQRQGRDNGARESGSNGKTKQES